MKLNNLPPIIINKALSLKENDCVEVTLIGERKYFDFLDEFTLTVAKCGAFPTIRLNSPSYLKRYLKELPEKYLCRTPPQALKRINEFHKYITIICCNPNPDFNSISKRKRQIALEAKRPIMEKIRHRNISVIYLPTTELAEYFNIPVSGFIETMYKALDIDYKKLKKNCIKVSKLLKNSDGSVEISTSNLYNISFKLSDRPIFQENGLRNLPAGSVFVAPVENSVNGSILLPKVPFKGKIIQNLLLHFKDGHLDSSSADKNHQVFQRRLNNCYGDKDVFAGFGIGLNPGISEPIGCEIIDPLHQGSIFICLGSNLRYGGNNSSDLFWAMTSIQPTLIIDGSTIINKGLFAAKLLS